MKLSDSNLNIWFKDRVLGNSQDPKDYLSQTVNIDVKELVDSDVFSLYVTCVSGELSDQVHSEVSLNVTTADQSAYAFYGYMLSLTNRQKLNFLYKTIGA